MKTSKPSNFYNWLTAPIDNSQLILFRIGFGFLLFAEAFGAILTGWVKEVFVDSPYTFTFIGFEFLNVLHGSFMYAYYSFMALLALMVTFGWRYRLGMFMYFIMWTGVYLAQKSHYNNHYYFTMLMTGLMTLVPASAYASFDVKRNNTIKSLTCQRWIIVLFISQIFILYFFGSLAKCNTDWINIKQMSIWFNAKKDFILIGPLLSKQWVQYTVAWGGILFDGLIVPAMLWRRTRKFAFIIAVFFHLFNSAVFQVGIFPYLGILLSVFFFPPETIRSIFFKKKPVLAKTSQETENKQSPKWLLAVMAVYLLFQIYLPLRHFLYPGNVFWTEEGHRLAWQMMARSKRSTAYYVVIDNETGVRTKILPQKVLPSHMARCVSSRPDVMWQFSQKIKEEYNANGIKDISIYVYAYAGLNGRTSQPYVDNKVDFAQLEWKRFEAKDWIVPIENNGKGFGY